MNPSEFYNSLVSQISEATERKVFDVLSREIGKRVPRAQLIFEVFGVTVAEDALAQSGEDRKVRKCIETLRLKGFPIVASSGEAGYTLVDDPGMLDGYISEEYARIAHIQKKIDTLRRGRQMAYSLHEWREATRMPVQEKLL